MMRKWRTDLYRYGLRMTYDLAIPTPGVRFWARWRRIAEIDAELKVPFVFPLKPGDLSDTNWPDKASEYGAFDVPPPPDDRFLSHQTQVVGPISEDDRHNIQYGKIVFDVPQGYFVNSCWAVAYITNWKNEKFAFRWFPGVTTYKKPPETADDEAHGRFNDFEGATGHLEGLFMYQTIQSAAITFDVVYERQPHTVTGTGRSVHGTPFARKHRRTTKNG